MSYSKTLNLIIISFLLVVFAGCSSRINLGTYSWDCNWCKDPISSRYEYVLNVKGGWNLKRDGQHVGSTEPMTRSEAYRGRYAHLKRFPARTVKKHGGWYFCSLRCISAYEASKDFDNKSYDLNDSVQ